MNSNWAHTQGLSFAFLLGTFFGACLICQFNPHSQIQKRRLKRLNDFNHD